MRYVMGIISILAIGYFIVANVLGGRIYFSEFFLAIGIASLILFLKFDWVINLNIIKANLKIIKIIMAIGVSCFILLEGAIILFPKKNTTKSDLVIVLGAGVRGKTPSLTLKRRLDATIKYINETGYKGKILVSGGQGPGEDITESEAMKSYLVNKGLDENRIIEENKSTSTFENLKYSKTVIKEELDKAVDGDFETTIITTDFHAMRSNMLAKRNGYENVKLYTSNTEWYLIPNMYVREFFAFAKSVALDR